MKSSAKKIELASVDDLFSTEEGRQDAKLEKIQEIPLSELHPFRNHPFKVKDDEAMMETADSIKQYGVLVPAIARPDPEGGYELVRSVHSQCNPVQLRFHFQHGCMLPLLRLPCNSMGCCGQEKPPEPTGFYHLPAMALR